MKLLCWLWRQEGGRTTYTAEHVNTWAAMVRRNLMLPHTLACVTDMPDGIDPGIEIIAPPGDFVGVKTPTWSGPLPNCFRRLALFRPDAADVFGAERIVSMDIDCVIAEPIDDLFDRPDDFVMFGGETKKRPYNGSLLMLTAGSRPHVFTRFNVRDAAIAGYQFAGSDQSWISFVLGPGEARWTSGDGVGWFRPSRSIEYCRVMFFHGANNRPWDWVSRNEWVRRHYWKDVPPVSDAA